MSDPNKSGETKVVRKSGQKKTLKELRERDRINSAEYAAKQKTKGFIRKTFWLTERQVYAIEKFLSKEKQEEAIRAARKLLLHI